jgi:hypothetical protein
MTDAQVSLLLDALMVIVAAIAAGVAVWAKLDSSASAKAAKESNRIATEAKSESKRSADAAEVSANEAKRANDLLEQSYKLQEQDFTKRNVPRAQISIRPLYPKSKDLPNDPGMLLRGGYQSPPSRPDGNFGLTVSVVSLGIDFFVSSVEYRFIQDGMQYTYRPSFRNHCKVSREDKAFQYRLYFPVPLHEMFERPFTLDVLVYTTDTNAPFFSYTATDGDCKAIRDTCKRFTKDCDDHNIRPLQWDEETLGPFPMKPIQAEDSQ